MSMTPTDPEEISPHQFDALVLGVIHGYGMPRLRAYMKWLIDEQDRRSKPHEIIQNRDAPLTRPQAEEAAEAYREMWLNGKIRVPEYVDLPDTP